MEVRSQQKRRKPMAEINVVPLIDVMLVLLIVFMVTTPLITQGIKVELPEAESEVIDQPQVSLEITIDAEGQYFINLGEEPAENPAPVPVEQIGEQVAKIMAANPSVPVYVGADGSIEYGTVITLINTLQEAGVTEPNLLTQPPGLEL
jgi:biopolymer transport protein TolR